MDSAPREGVSVEARWADLWWRLSTDERASTGSTTDEGLSDKTRALVRLAVLIAVDSAPASYQWAVATARSAGAVDDEIVGVLLTVGDILDAAWVMSAAAALAPALGAVVPQGAVQARPRSTTSQVSPSAVPATLRV